MMRGYYFQEKRGKAEEKQKVVNYCHDCRRKMRVTGAKCSGLGLTLFESVSSWPYPFKGKLYVCKLNLCTWSEIIIIIFYQTYKQDTDTLYRHT